MQLGFKNLNVTNQVVQTNDLIASDNPNLKNSSSIDSVESNQDFINLINNLKNTENESTSKAASLDTLLNPNLSDVDEVGKNADEFTVVDDKLKNKSLALILNNTGEPQLFNKNSELLLNVKNENESESENENSFSKPIINNTSETDDLFISARAHKNPLMDILNDSSLNNMDKAAQINDIKLFKKIDPDLDVSNDKIVLNSKNINNKQLLSLLKSKMSNVKLSTQEVSQLNKVFVQLEKNISLENSLVQNELTTSKLLKPTAFDNHFFSNVAEKNGERNNLSENEFKKIDSKKINSKFKITAFTKNQPSSEKSLFNLKVHNENESLTQNNNENKNILDFNQNEVDTKKIKEFSFNNISEANTENRGKLIKNITSYIEKNNVKLESGIELTVQHNELGKFKIQAQNQNNELKLQVTSMNKEGHDFFLNNKQAIEQSLKDHGVKISEVKVVFSADKIVGLNPASNKNNGFNFDGNNNFQNGNQHHSSGHGQFQGDEGTQRRQAEWDRYKEQLNKFAS